MDGWMDRLINKDLKWIDYGLMDSWMGKLMNRWIYRSLKDIDGLRDWYMKG